MDSIKTPKKKEKEIGLWAIRKNGWQRRGKGVSRTRHCPTQFRRKKKKRLRGGEGADVGEEEKTPRGGKKKILLRLINNFKGGSYSDKH